MPQLQLPLLPSGSIDINGFINVRKNNGYWYYFAGISPVFSHDENDLASFRMFTSQLIASGQCRNVDIERTFGVSSNSVKRSLKKYKEEGIKSFFEPRKGRGGSIMTNTVKEKCQEYLDNGWSRKQICEKLNIKTDTLRKSISAGHLHEPKINKISKKK